MDKNEIKTYSIKCHRGIDDLLSIYAFYYNDGGGGVGSNDIEWYKDSKGWISFIFDGIDPTNQEAINEESRRRVIENDKYITQLIKEGRYKEEYEISISMVYNPLFDAPSLHKGELEPYTGRIVFLDFSKPNKNEE